MLKKPPKALKCDQGICSRFLLLMWKWLFNQKEPEKVESWWGVTGGNIALQQKHEDEEEPWFGDALLHQNLTSSTVCHRRLEEHVRTCVKNESWSRTGSCDTTTQTQNTPVNTLRTGWRVLENLNPTPDLIPLRCCRVTLKRLKKPLKHLTADLGLRQTGVRLVTQTGSISSRYFCCYAILTFLKDKTICLFGQHWCCGEGLWPRCISFMNLPVRCNSWCLFICQSNRNPSYDHGATTCCHCHNIVRLCYFSIDNS